MKRILQILNIIVFLIMVMVNYAASSGAINGNTISIISAQYENLFTPAGYAFSIWGLIYLGLFLFVIYQARDMFMNTRRFPVALKMGWWFIVSCTANIFWIFAWINEYLGLSVIIMAILLFALIMIIFNTRMELDDEPLSVIAFVWWPFSIYSGWITVAFIANMAAWLTSEAWDGFGFSEVIWTVVMIITAGIINLVITWTRNMREFALVGAWALVAIAVANWGQHQTIVISALTVSGILVISSGYHGYLNREFSPWKKL